MARAQEVEAIFEIYGRVCTNFSKCLKITADRRKMAHKLLAGGESLESIEAVFLKANECKFLYGFNNRGWKADIDFMLNEKKYTKVLEGAYDHCGDFGHGTEPRGRGVDEW